VVDQPSELSSLGRSGTSTFFDVSVYDVNAGGALKSLVHTAANEAQGRFSPDQHSIAYISDESGRFEVYVRPFLGQGEKTRVSTTGGFQPRWRSDGKELFYLSPDREVMAVDTQRRGDENDNPLTILLNWTAALKK
jgi:Tol biopolymer transport system component